MSDCVEIPIAPGVGDQTLTVQLDNQTFILRAHWNWRESRWFLDISDSDGLIIAARPVLVDVPLWRRFASRRLPLGEAIAIDTSGKDLDPALADLGARVKLLYLSESITGVK